jgi:hypothetical protein
MGKIAEFLAGCPRPETPDEKKMPWQSIRAFPGIMFNRMYILLTRPREAIGGFGAGDYKTPFCFFLFFTIITAFLHSLASLLWIAFLGSGLPEQDISGALAFPADSLWNLLLGTFETTLLALLYLGISVVILALGLWLITGIRSGNPAFTISAYCYPIPALISLIVAFADIPWGFHVPPAMNTLAVALAIVWILLMVVIAGYGVVILMKTPVLVALILALLWIILGMLVSYLAQNFIIIPPEYGLSQWTSATFFPHSYPVAGS